LGAMYECNTLRNYFICKLLNHEHAHVKLDPGMFKYNTNMI